MRLKSDSFVVESNVHFPTDYNLLWDCARKCLDVVSAFLEKYDHLDKWHKITNWRYELKGFMRELGKASGSGGENKQDRIIIVTKKCLKKAKAFNKKLTEEYLNLPLDDMEDLSLTLSLEHFMGLLNKHINLYLKEKPSLMKKNYSRYLKRIPSGLRKEK